MPKKKLMSLKCGENAHKILKKLSLDTGLKVSDFIDSVIKEGAKVVKEKSKK